MNRLKDVLFIFLLEMGGLTVLWHFVSFWAALGVFLFVWGNNRGYSFRLRSLKVIE